MNLQQMHDYVEQEMQKQCSASLKIFAPLLKSMLE